MKLKYIRTRYHEIIVFPETQVHSDIKFRGEAFSAGFIKFGKFEDGGNVKCFGESVSLQLDSDRRDSELAEKQFFGD